MRGREVFKTLAKYSPTELTKEHQVYTLEGQKPLEEKHFLLSSISKHYGSPVAKPTA